MRETISDYLRYILLILAIGLLAFLIFITVRVYQRYDDPADDNTIEILTEVETQKKTELQSEKNSETVLESESEKSSEKSSETASEKVTEKTSEKTSESISSEAAAKPVVVQTEGQKQTETEKQSSNINETVPSTEKQTITVTNIEDIPLPEIRTIPETQPVTEPPVIETEPPQPVYRTINSTCYLRSYPDYGENILGECYAGQTVEFLGPEAGWYKVNADGVIGYIGPKFLN